MLTITPAPLTLSATGGTAYGYEVQLGFQPNGVLTRLYVVQTAGALEGFSYALYTYGGACPPGPSPATNATVPRGLYNLVPALVVASGAADFQGTWGGTDGVNQLWQPFSIKQAADAPPTDNYLYLEIDPAGSGAKTFMASITFMPSAQY